MAARAYWQGQIKLALVSIPVEIYPATKSGAAISFHQIHEPSGKRIRYEKVAPGVGPVDRDEIVKGFEVSKGNYVLLDDEEIEAIKIESRKRLDLVQFVEASEIDVLYYDKPYFVVPADDLAEEAYVVLPYSARVRPGAPTAIPISWDQLDGAKDARPFDIGDARMLIEAAHGKALGGWDFATQALPQV